MVQRLAEDHENARALAEGMAPLEGLSVDLESVQSNIVNLDVTGLGIDAATFARHLESRGVRALPGLDTVVRFVTYRGITLEAVQQALSAIREMVAQAPWSRGNV
jgi:threonine aldolase